ncbi:putative methyltransferase [Prochlorococcus marinus str. MIT 9211]|uniref:Arsenite methyltransferase n=1 Tax=Prochlorococcus marinus (strain MIT 9211) TaxID=93059 RepID=A9BE35_PROM4|nr:putative methyltransferase [Prochlorococcus marinus str. MIT 9211]
MDKRYGAAAIDQEKCLCSPIAFNPKLLEVIPAENIEKDYGCGDPTRWIKKGDIVLDLGSGSGKNAFICAQVVGKSGHVIGIDRNNEMLALSRQAAPIVAARIGFSNMTFLEGDIQALDSMQGNGEQLVKDASIDVVISNCVLNLVNPSDRERLLRNIKRVLRRNGRVAISDIVSNKKVPLNLQEDPELWSGCISGAWQEDQFINDFKNLGFKEVICVDRSSMPWKVIEGIEFRSITLTGYL